MYDPEAQTMTCPAGKTTTSKWYSADGEVTVYKFSRKMCRHCPRAKDCIGAKGYMSASVSVYHEELEAAAAYSETEAFRLDKAIRARIEVKFAEAKRFHGMARAIYRGLQKVDLQVRLTAIALNIKRIFTLLQEPKASALAEPEAAYGEVCPFPRKAPRRARGERIHSLAGAKSPISWGYMEVMALSRLSRYSPCSHLAGKN
ncbi:MAG: transposase [Synergistales bacterium]|nr:transposase [Synergistales bacterium]